jgi:hypothetical protein
MKGMHETMPNSIYKRWRVTRLANLKRLETSQAKKKVKNYSVPRRGARHLTPAMNQASASPLILFRSYTEEASLCLHALAFLSFHGCHTKSRIRERIPFLGILEVSVNDVHRWSTVSVGDQEFGRTCSQVLHSTTINQMRRKPWMTYNLERMEYESSRLLSWPQRWEI